MHHAKSDAARGAAAQALLDRGYGKSVAVSMDIVDEGQAHLEALQELADRRQRINREKTPAEATSPPWLAIIDLGYNSLMRTLIATRTEEDQAS